MTEENLISIKEFILRWIQNMSSSYFNFQIKGLLEKEKYFSR